jgi:hypothetical protein
VAYTSRQRWIALGVGVLFAGIVFGLFKAIELVTVPVAILSYFIYPLLTGIIGALIGIDKLGWRGAAAAIVAFCGLALIVGAQPGTVALSGVAFALGAGCLRTAVLLIARPWRRRFAAHLVYAGVVHGDLRRLLARHLELASAADRHRVDRAVGGERHRYHRGADAVHFDQPRRSIPQRADHEPRAAAGNVLSAALGEVMTHCKVRRCIMLGALVAFQLKR